MRMEKRKFRIGELAEQLQVEQFVIRFWEKEFSLKTVRSTGGQRFYREQDLETFKKIKELLYEKGFTIAGAKKQLLPISKQQRVIGSKKSSFTNHEEEITRLKQKVEVQKVEFEKQILLLKEQLTKLL